MDDDKMPMQVEFVPVTKIEDCQRAWIGMHEQSEADALFMGWEWQSSWWKAFADKNLRCSLIQPRHTISQSMALLPCYSCDAVVKGLWPIKRLQLIGAVFRGSITTKQAIRSEHLGIVLKSDAKSHSAVISDVVQETCALTWQEFVLQDLDCDLDVNRHLVAAFAKEGLFVRIAERNSSYSISLPAKFEDYLTGLSGNARRRLYNKRAVLAESGKAEVVNLSNDDWRAAVEVLSDLHALRWGKPVYSEAQFQFHTMLRERLGADKVEVSCLLLDGQPISALHNITVDGIVYNLQSGFDPTVDSRISPMLLHFGMVIEEAIKSGHRRIHLLAGAGKHSNYKADISTDEHNLVDIQIIRDKALAMAYKTYDLLTRKKTQMTDFPNLNFP